MQRNLFAFTAVENPYPTFVSINEKGGIVTITTRAKPDGDNAGALTDVVLPEKESQAVLAIFAAADGADAAKDRIAMLETSEGAVEKENARLREANDAFNAEIGRLMEEIKRATSEIEALKQIPPQPGDAYLLQAGVVIGLLDEAGVPPADMARLFSPNFGTVSRTGPEWAGLIRTVGAGSTVLGMAGVERLLTDLESRPTGLEPEPEAQG